MCTSASDITQLGKDARKFVSSVQVTRDPVWRSRFSFQVSAMLLGDFAVTVTVWMHDKFGRDQFLGLVEQEVRGGSAHLSCAPKFNAPHSACWAA